MVSVGVTMSHAKRAMQVSAIIETLNQIQTEI